MLLGGCGLSKRSSVFRIETREGRRLGDDPGLRRKIRIEAVAVRLPTGVLFALPRDAAGPDYPAYLLRMALERGSAVPRLSRIYGSGEWQEREAEARRVRPRITLDPRDYPTLVRFADLAREMAVTLAEREILARGAETSLATINRQPNLTHQVGNSDTIRNARIAVTSKVEG